MKYETGRLNILQITTHDTGRHLGCYGHPTLNTPNLGAVAAEGVRFANYFASVPICCASRASMLTGRYPQSHGLMDLCFAPFDWRLHDDELHLSHIMRDAGYRSLLFGTQHEVAKHEIDRLAFHEVRAQAKPSCDEVAAEAASFLDSEAAGAQPFYAQVGFFETHTPFDRHGTQPDTSRGVEVPPYLMEDECSRRTMAAFQGAIRRVDGVVGAIVEALRRSGLEDNTLLVFTTDHGIEVPRAKWFLYDPGIAVALLMRCPALGLTGGRVCDLLLSNVDYLPTVLELTGVPVPERVQGRSFAAALRERDPSPVRDAVFAMYHKTQGRCVRTGRFKLIRYFDAPTDLHRVPVSIENVLMRRGIKRVELFDLENDPNEFTNVAHDPEFAETRRRLDAMLWEWMDSVQDPLLSGPVRSPTYENAMGDYEAWKRDQ